MNKKGFTLVELLVVIALLSLITVMAVSSFSGANKSIKGSMLDTKITLIEEAAKLYGQDNKDLVINSIQKYNGNPCKSIIVSELVPEYLNKDNKNDCLNRDEQGNGCVVDPSNSTNYLDKYEVIIYSENNIINSIVDKNNELNCS